MPIHDQGYRRYGGERLPRGRTWLIIARSGIRSMIGRRAFVALLVASWLPFLVRAVQLYAAANLPQAQFLAPTGEMFRQFLGQQEVFLFFVTVYAGAGLIAPRRPIRDRCAAVRDRFCRRLVRLPPLHLRRPAGTTDPPRGAPWGQAAVVAPDQVAYMAA